MIPIKCEISTIVNSRYAEKAEWPTKLATRPLKGDYIESKHGNNTLQVLSVTHATVRVSTRDSSGLSYEDVPGLKIHLGIEIRLGK